MKLPSLLLLAYLSSLALAASSWGFTDATVAIHGKGSGVGGIKEKLSPKKPLSKPIELKADDSLKILLTTQDGKTASRPHQTFLNLRDATSGLETSYAFSVKDSGKAKLELTHKDLPAQFLLPSASLTATLYIASFGTSTPYASETFTLSIIHAPGAPLPTLEVPLRYGKLPEIHHIFKPDPTSPPKIISLFFTCVVLAALPAVLLAWVALGANVNHLGTALGKSPVSHALFFGSILVMEGIFFMYYTSWNLFQTLPAAFAVSVVTFLSGSRALSEVQERRLAGLR